MGRRKPANHSHFDGAFRSLSPRAGADHDLRRQCRNTRWNSGHTSEHTFCARLCVVLVCGCCGLFDRFFFTSPATMSKKCRALLVSTNPTRSSSPDPTFYGRHFCSYVIFLRRKLARISVGSHPGLVLGIWLRHSFGGIFHAAWFQNFWMDLYFGRFCVLARLWRWMATPQW